MNLSLFVVILYGVLAAACPGVLERVAERRLANGWGLTEPARAGDVLLGVEDCSLLGKRALVIVGDETHDAYVVDCQKWEHRLTQPLHHLGIAADVNDGRLNHKPATVVIIR